MGFLAIMGGEGRNNDANDITVISGAISYLTSPLPAGGSTACLRGNNATVFEFPFTAAKSEFWIHAQVYTAQNNSTNDTQYLGWATSGGLLGRVLFQDNTNLVQIEINSVVQATSGTGISLSTWERLHIHVKIDSTAGFVKVYADGDVSTALVEFSGDTDPTAAVNADRMQCGLNDGRYFDDIIVMDPNDGTGTTSIQLMLDPAVVPSSPNGAGNYTDWTGAYTDIDEVPPSDADKISASAIDQASTFAHADVAAGKTVLGVKWVGKFIRSDTSAGENMNIRRRRSAADTDTANIPVPGAGYIQQIFDQADGPSAWDRTKFNDTEWGVVSRT